MSAAPEIRDGSRSPSVPPSVQENIAVYAFYDFSKAQLAEICRTCEEDGADPGCGENRDYMFAAPQTFFSSGSVEEVIEYHKAMTQTRRYKDRFDPDYLVVAKSVNWRTEGVLAVCLNKDFLKEIPDDGEAYKKGWDAWMFKPQGVGLTFLNLQIANLGWPELTAWDELQPEGQQPDQRDGRTVYEIEEDGEEQE